MVDERGLFKSIQIHEHIPNVNCNQMSFSLDGEKVSKSEFHETVFYKFSKLTVYSSISCFFTPWLRFN